MQTCIQLDKCPVCLLQIAGSEISFWLSRCGHIMCNACLLHGLGKAAAMACPVCKCTLTRTNSFFPHEQMTALLEMEGAIRRVVLNDLMKTGDMFGQMKDYNRYLEEVETMIYNIPNNVKLDEVNRQYARNKRKSVHRLETSEREMNTRRALYMEDTAQKAERSQRSVMLEGLARGTISGTIFVQNAQTLYKPQEPKLQVAETATAPSASSSSTSMPPPASTYTYRPVAQQPGAGLPRPVFTPAGGRPGQQPAGAGMIVRDNVLPYLDSEQEARSMAGGYKPELVKKRLIEEAFGGLWG